MKIKWIRMTNVKVQISNECQMTNAKKICPPVIQIQPIQVDTDKGQMINNYSFLKTF